MILMPGSAGLRGKCRSWSLLQVSRTYSQVCQGIRTCCPAQLNDSKSARLAQQGILGANGKTASGQAWTQLHVYTACMGEAERQKAHLLIIRKAAAWLRNPAEHGPRHLAPDERSCHDQPLQCLQHFWLTKQAQSQ